MNTVVMEFMEKTNESLENEWLNKIFMNAIMENDATFMKRFIHHYDTFVKMYID